MALTDANSWESLVDEAERLRKSRLLQRISFEELWWNNIALIAGDHYARWEPTLGDYVTPADPDGHIRLVLNQARVVARTELAKTVKSRPISEVIPKSMDEEDISAARVGKFALESLEWAHKLKKRRKQAQWWTIVTGCAGIYVGYDPENATAGTLKFVIDPNTNEPAYNPQRVRQIISEAHDNNEEPEVEEYPMGECEYRLYTPFQMLPDDTVLSFDDIKDIIVTDVVGLEVAKKRWPNLKRELRGDGSQPGGLSGRLLSMAGLTGAASMTEPGEDTLSVHTYWLPANVYSGFLKNGAMLRWANGNILLEGIAFPYSDNRIPMAFFQHTENAISLWPDTVITDVRPVNLELDKTISQLLENRDYMVNPMWRIAEQHQVRKFKNVPGGEVRYVAVPGVEPPEPIPGVPLPTQIENLVVGLRDQILDISGQGEVSRGRMPSGVRSGVQIAYLQEEDETRLGPVSENFEDAVALMGSLALSRLSQFYTVERLLRAYKEGGRADVRRFKGADLKGNTDVIVQSGSSLPTLKAARQQFILEMAQLGVETDPKKIRDMLELGDNMPDEYDLAAAQAERENEVMRQVGIQVAEVEATISSNGNQNGDTGVVEQQTQQIEEQASAAIPVKKWHKHEVHLRIHYSYMMSTEFEKMTADPQHGPAIGRLFDEHTALHEQAIQEALAQQAMLAQQMRGGSEAAQMTSETVPTAGMSRPPVG